MYDSVIHHVYPPPKLKSFSITLPAFVTSLSAQKVDFGFKETERTMFTCNAVSSQIIKFVEPFEIIKYMTYFIINGFFTNSEVLLLFTLIVLS